MLLLKYTIMAKSISLKIDEEILKDVESTVSRLGVSRNRYINDAVAAYNKAQRRTALEEQMKIASHNVRESSMEVLAEFEALEDDYEAI